MKSGALVRFVAPSAPAEKAGVKPGDIIVKIGDTPDRQRRRRVRRRSGEHKIGEVVPFEVVRGDQTHHARRDARL